MNYELEEFRNTVGKNIITEIQVKFEGDSKGKQY